MHHQTVTLPNFATRVEFGRLVQRKPLGIQKQHVGRKGTAGAHRKVAKEKKSDGS